MSTAQARPLLTDSPAAATQASFPSSERYAAHVDRVIDGFFLRSKRRAAVLGESYLLLWQTLESNAAGGKRFRPQIAMMAYEGLGGTDLDAAAHVGAVFELLHTALIVHDDVIDRDFIRRGSLNVSGSYRDIAQTAGIPIPIAEHRGMSVAVVAGDLALAGAYRLIDHCPIDAVLRARLTDLIDEAVFASAAGELMDVDFSLGATTPSVADVIEMERQKTAVYSFEKPLQAGAALAGADDDVIELLGEVGRCLGIAYQIVDDLLGVFGDERETGKTTLGDLREGKRTVPIAYAATRPQWASITSRLGQADLPRHEAERIRALLVECGAQEYSLSLARDFANRAWETLYSPRVPPALRESLRAVVASVLRRTR
jgi:geranylgeranyl diphosphate synthase type II